MIVRSGYNHFVARIRSLTFFWSRFRSLFTRLQSSQTFDSFYRSLYVDGQPGWEATKRAFLELRDLSRERSIEVQVVMLPELHDLIDYPFTNEYRKVESFLRENSIQVLDLTPFFLGTEYARSLWVAPDDAHPNEVAHQMIAE